MKKLFCIALCAALLPVLFSACSKGSAVEPVLTVGGTEITDITSTLCFVTATFLRPWCDTCGRTGSMWTTSRCSREKWTPIPGWPNT